MATPTPTPNGKPQPRGSALRWTKREIADLANITEADKKAAEAMWDRVNKPLRGLLRAKPQTP